ncbi:MAG: alpha/beta hydrolase, partial [Clostridia bacterium]
ERAPNVKGYIVCGSCYMKGLLYKVGHMISNHMCKKQGGRTPCTMLANMSFGAYEKKFPGKNCWLNREQSEVDKYNADPACGFTCSANFYRSFMGAMNPLYSKTAVAGIDKNKPIFIISGALDPVGNYGKGVDKLLEFYQKVGVVDVTEKLYEGARHEILNETHKNETYQDIIKWLNAHR